MNRQDKRVKRTRIGLAKALIELSREQGYDAVTIQRITEQAGIHYRTFFRHYESKDDLLRDVLDSTLDDLQQILQPLTEDDFQRSDFEVLAREKGRLLYEYVGRHKDLFIVFMQSGPAAFDPAQEFAQAKAERFIAALPGQSIPRELVAKHMVASTFSVIQWWLDNGMVQSPEQMGGYAAQLIMLPIRQLLLENVQEASP